MVICHYFDLLGLSFFQTIHLFFLRFKQKILILFFLFIFISVIKYYSRTISSEIAAGAFSLYCVMITRFAGEIII